MAGSMYLERGGWVILDDNSWEKHSPESKMRSLSAWLGHRDSHLRYLETWGESQLAPQWETPRRQTIQATLVDLKNAVFTQTTVIDPPRANALVPLAVHGCGMTCMLIHRPQNKTGGVVSHKVGMINMPSYVLAQGVRSGTILIGGCMDVANSVAKEK